MSQIPAAVGSVGAGAPRERVFTGPLSVFLALVVGLLAYAGYQKVRTPSLAEAVRELADGDLDGAERAVALRAVVLGAANASSPADRWAGLLAAVALEDRTAYSAFAAQLGGNGVPGSSPLQNLPVPEERTFLHLGDPMLGNLLAACAAEASGDRAGAMGAFGHVQAECKLRANPLAAELAANALQRLR